MDVTLAIYDLLNLTLEIAIRNCEQIFRDYFLSAGSVKCQNKTHKVDISAWEETWHLTRTPQILTFFKKQQIGRIYKKKLNTTQGYSYFR